MTKQRIVNQPRVKVDNLVEAGIYCEHSTSYDGSTLSRGRQPLRRFSRAKDNHVIPVQTGIYCGNRCHGMESRLCWNDIAGNAFNVWSQDEDDYYIDEVIHVDDD